MKYIPFFALLMFWTGSTINAQKSIQEQLGYSPDAKLLIIHADDLGVTHSTNQATFTALTEGSVKSASAMVPTPWFPEVAKYATAHPQHDLGIHLTLTSEWQLLRWGPVAPLSKVSSLVDENGYFFSDCETMWANAKIEEVEIELRAQLEQAIRMGLSPTHIDNHMRCLASGGPEFYELYLKMSREYNIPAMVDQGLVDFYASDPVSKPEVMLNTILGAGTSDYEAGMREYYARALRNLESGVQIMIIHSAYDDRESQGMSFEHPYWGAKWRQHDFDFFTSAECAKILKEENIHLVTWKEIRTLLKE